jgi:hypothetical protein
MTTSPYKLNVTVGDKEVYKVTLPRVTTILDSAFGGDGLARWYYNNTVIGFSHLISKYGGNLPSDIPSLHSLLSTEGVGPNKKRDESQEYGSKLHDVLHRLAIGRKVRETADNQRLLDWFYTSVIAKHGVIATEKTVISLREGYAGTLDLVWRTLEGKVRMTDLKTGTIMEAKMRCQLQAYTEAWHEMGGEKIDEWSILHVPRDGSEASEIKITPDPTEWAAALTIYRAQRKGK